ncbi:MAG: hypothetical protein AMJ90_04815 [candidate division Zixibacteria bacterium SM23_73_2]|nr:MAG: hypothetical protein AMJ90_04815 [candidate division Zixibacteria bacterium SM23_73_2]
MKRSIYSCLMFILMISIGWAAIGYAQNMPPVWEPIEDTTLSEGDHLKLRVFATDPDLDSIVLSVDGLPSNATFEDSGNGAGLFRFDPDHFQAGSYAVTFIASDTILADSEEVNITVENETWAWVWINDTTATTGKQDSKISVMMETEIPIGGIDLKFIVNRNDVLNFSTDRIDTSVEGNDTIIVRVMDLDTTGCCTSDYEWLYPYGDLGDSSSPTCRWMTVAGKIEDHNPIPIGTCLLFKIYVDMLCYSDTNSNRTAYIDIVGSLSDSIGFRSIQIMNYGTVTILPSNCGDVNADEMILLDDVLQLAYYYFGKGPAPCPIESGDIDQDDMITIGDAIVIANYIFKGIKIGCFAEP